eukprot:COSAG01_NODE_230_length_21075_cov_13.811603_24_plen_70_part_00
MRQVFIVGHNCRHDWRRPYLPHFCASATRDGVQYAVPDQPESLELWREQAQHGESLLICQHVRQFPWAL